MAITHAFVSVKSDGPDTTLVRPTNWNAGHVIDSATVGTGDALTVYGSARTAQLLGVVKGTTGSGDLSAHPLFKVERTMSVADATLTGLGDASEALASFEAIGVGTTSLPAQAVGIFAGAKHAGTTAGSEGRGPDACAMYAVARIEGSGTGSAIGGFFSGRRDADAARMTGIEVAMQNFGTSAGAYTSSGASDLKGMWIHAFGNADSGVGIQFNNPFGRQFKVGIGFGNQVANSLTGAVADSSIRDDGVGAISLDIRGTHATAAIQVANGSGFVGIGGAPTVLLDVIQAGSGTTARFSSSTVQQTKVYIENGAGDGDAVLIFLLPATKAWMMGVDDSDGDKFKISATETSTWTGAVVAFDTTSVILTDAVTLQVGSTTGTKIATATTQKLGFWNATPVVQPTGIADVSGGSVIDAEVRTAFNSLLTKLETIGILAAA